MRKWLMLINPGSDRHVDFHKEPKKIDTTYLRVLLPWLIIAILAILALVFLAD